MGKFSELKAAAMAATPGPWFVHEKPCEDGNYGIDTSDNEWTAEAVVWWGFARQSIWKEEDARFIAAANPAVVLGLLAERDSDKKRIAELSRLLAHNIERAEAAEAKLAKPIQIVNYDEFFICHVSGASDDYCKGWVDGRNAAARDVGKAGFTVEDKQ